MFLQTNFITYNPFQDIFCAVEHSQGEQIHYLLLKKHKNEFIKENENTAYSFSELQKNISKQQQLFLIINNEHVFTKKINGIFNIDEAFIKAFSNSKKTDFYIELVHSNNCTFITICRRNIVDDLLMMYKNADYYVIQFSLGNLVSTQILHLIDNNNFSSSNAIIEKKDNKIFAINELGDENNTNIHKFNINGLIVSNTTILSLSGIICVYSKSVFSESNFNQQITLLQEEYKHKRIFNGIFKFGGILILALLLISFLIFSNYQEKSYFLSNENAVNESLMKTFDKLKIQTDKKKKLLSELSNTNSKVSFYLDELGVRVPKTILLTQINYQPKLKSIKKQKEILVSTDQIIIKGIVLEDSNFSLWVKKMERLDWIRSIEILSYGTEKSKVIKFKILITIEK